MQSDIDLNSGSNSKPLAVWHGAMIYCVVWLYPAGSNSVSRKQFSQRCGKEITSLLRAGLQEKLHKAEASWFLKERYHATPLAASVGGSPVGIEMQAVRSGPLLATVRNYAINQQPCRVIMMCIWDPYLKVSFLLLCSVKMIQPYTR